jgi:hypothetical protein
MSKPKQTEPMHSYTFTLILAGIQEVTDEVEDALFEAGCDDALLGSRDGVVFLDFEREASSAREAVLSAIADVAKSGIGARVARVEPDEFVTMAEIARRANRSRENIRQLVAGLRGPGDFPPPVANLKQKSPIWRWADVEAWLRQKMEGENALSLLLPPPSTPSGLGSEVAAINAGLEMLSHTGVAAEAKKLLESLQFQFARRSPAESERSDTTSDPFSLGERMRYLIDGYNLLHAMGLLAGRVGPRGLEKARLALLGRLHGLCGDVPGRVTVVFDASGAGRGASAEQDYHGVRVRFALGEEADDVIEDLIRRDPSPGDLTVVSDDLRLRQAARRRRCPALGCLDFIEQATRPPRPAGHPGSSAKASPRGT